MKLSKKLLSLLLCAVMVLSSVAIGGEGFAKVLDAFIVKASALESTGNSTLDAFINDSRYTAGKPWAWDYQGTSYQGWGCCSYCSAYTQYCYGNVNPRSGELFYDAWNIRGGDVLTIGNQSDGTGHWFVCLKRNGNKLYVAEGNYNNSIRIGWNYTITSGCTFAEDGRTFTAGYHYLTSSPSLSGKPVVTISDGTYCLFSKLGTYVLDVSNGSLDATVYSTANGANIQVFSPFGYTAQRFDIGYNNVIKANYIQNTGSGKYVDSQGDTNGTTNVWQWEGNGTNGQNWLFEDCGDGYYYIRNLWGYYLTVDYDNAYDGQNVGVWYFNGANGQKWKPVKVSGKNKTIVASGDYYIYSAVGDKVLDISNSGTYSSANNTNAQIYSPKQNKCQLFTIDYNDNWKSNNIALKAAGKWVDVEGNECREANCRLYEGNGNACQNWVFEDAGSGYYYIRNMWGYYLSVVSNSNTEGQNVKGLTFSGGTGQKWKLIKTESTKPTGSISSTNNVASSQTVTLSMSDNAGIAGYYWGTSSSYSSNTYTAVSGTSKSVTKTVSSNGTYYLTVKDTSGNISSTVSKTFYKTTLNANGGSVSPASVITMSGNSFTLPTTTRSGYSYKNWNTVSDGSGTSYTGSYKPTGNVTLYAQWTPNTYTVSYNANGGSDAPSSQTKTYDKILTLSSTKPTRTGYTFKNWNTKADGTGTSYSAGASYTANAAVTLYAQWTANTYTVTYNANGGTGVPANQTKTYGTTLTLSSTKPTREGYTFLGWAETSTATTAAYQAGGSFTKDANTTLYAVWNKNAATYTVKYDANGGSGAPASQTKIEGTTLALSSTKPTRTGYTFKNWNTKSDGTGTSYSSGASYTANAAVTLYAQWTENHNHNYTKSVTKPTCTQQGYTTYTCNCGDTYKSDYTVAIGHNYVNGVCTRCGASEEGYSLNNVKESAKAELDLLKNDAVSDEAKTILDNAIASVENAADVNDVAAITSNAKSDAENADKALADAKAAAKTELETAKNNAVSDEAKAAIDTAIENVDKATNPDAVAYAKAKGTSNAQNADNAYAEKIKFDNVNIKVAGAQTVDYRSIVTITATATDVPEGYKLAIYLGSQKVAEGDNKSVSYEYGEIKSDINYTVKVIDANGKVQKDSNGKELTKDGGKITVNSSFFAKIIAFFKGLFGMLPTVIIKP